MWKGDIREVGCRATVKTFANCYFSIFSEVTFLLPFPVRRLICKWSLYLADCLCWIIMLSLWCTLTAHLCFLEQKGLFCLVSETVLSEGFFGVLWIILNLAFVLDFIHLINFLIAQEYYKSWKELPRWCPKYRNNNLFEMGKLRNITSYPKVISPGLGHIMTFQVELNYLPIRTINISIINHLGSTYCSFPIGLEFEAVLIV